MEKKYLFYFLINIILFTSCETQEEYNIIEIQNHIPAEIRFGDNDTLSFKVSSLRNLNVISLREVDNSDTISYATLGRSFFKDSTYYFNLNFIYNPKSTGNHKLFLFVRAGDIYEEYLNFEIRVLE